MREPDQASVAPHSAEVALLLACNDTSIESNRVLRLDGLLSAKIDWSHFLRVAEEQRMVPQAYWHLRHVGDKVPGDILRRMHEAFSLTLARKLFFSSRLLELLSDFQGAAIRAIPFKGPTFGLQYYGNLGLRDFEDLDILVDKSDVAVAEKLLLRHGYIRQDPSSRVQEHVIWRSGHERSFISHDRQTVVELQWGFVWKHLSFSLPFSELWERAERFNFGGTQVATLSPEDLLLILCVHGAKHEWERLIWVCDVSQVLRTHHEIQWTEVFQRARRLGCERILLLGLQLAHGVMGAPLPDGTLRRLRGERSVESLARQVYRGIRANDAKGTNGPAAGSFSWFFFRTRERVRDRIDYVLMFAITPTQKDWGRVALPPRLYFIYSILRLIRLSSEFLIKLVATIQRKVKTSNYR